MGDVDRTGLSFAVNGSASCDHFCPDPETRAPLGATAPEGGEQIENNAALCSGQQPNLESCDPGGANHARMGPAWAGNNHFASRDVTSSEADRVYWRKSQSYF